MTQPNCEPLQYPSADKNHIIAGYLYTLPRRGAPRRDPDQPRHVRVHRPLPGI